MNSNSQLIESGEREYDNENYEEALKYFFKACESVTSNKEKGFIYEMIGRSYYNLNIIKKAVKFLISSKEILQEYEKHCEESAQAISCVNFYLQKIFYDMGEYEKSLQYAFEYFKYLDLLESLDEKYLAYMNIGSSFEALKKYEQAIEYYKLVSKSLRLAKEDGITPVLSIGRCYLYLKDYKKALTYFNNCLPNINFIKNSTQADLFRYLGECYAELGNNKMAVEFYNRASQIVELDKFNWMDLYLYGDCAYKVDKFITTINCYEKILWIVKKSKKKYLCSVLNTLGFSYQAIRKYNKSLYYLKKAIPVCKDNLKKILLCMAQNHFGLGKLKRTIYYSLQLLDKDLELESKERLYYMLSFSYFTLNNSLKGKIYLDKLINLNKISVYTREIIGRWESELGSEYIKILQGK